METTPMALRPMFVCARKWMGRNRVAVDDIFGTMTQGSSHLATLGFETESRWDSKNGVQPTATGHPARDGDCEKNSF